MIACLERLVKFIYLIYLFIYLFIFLFFYFLFFYFILFFFIYFFIFIFFKFSIYLLIYRFYLHYRAAKQWVLRCMACFKGSILISSSHLPLHPLFRSSIFSLHTSSLISSFSHLLYFILHPSSPLFLLFSSIFYFPLYPPPCLFFLYTICPSSLDLPSFSFLISLLFPFF